MKLRIGTRRSPLALWQAHHVTALLKGREAGLEVELVEIVTKGDKILDSPLAKVGGKGLFVKEIEEQLLSGAVDLAVHSLKDMPAELPEGLVLAAVPPREDPRDAFVSSRHKRLEDLPKGAKVGTSSLRRASQLKAWRRDLEIVSIRGNVQTRLRKIDTELDAGILAAAGLKRLELADKITEFIEPERILPAVGQGVLALEARGGDQEVLQRLAALEDGPTRVAVTAERAFLRRLGGGCQVPIAAHATVSGKTIDFRGMVGHPDGSRVVEFAEKLEFASLEEVERLGVRGAEAVLSRGAQDILAEVLGPGGIPES
ncbi:MAG TPA: hydroxymethylbilane synthase [Myxococcales bacterium]|jgi:hydroxymethylbilane synthase